MSTLKKKQLVLIIASLFTSNLAYSADETVEQGDKKKQDFETIEVTASGRATTAQNLPMNITAMGSEELRKKNISDIKDLIADSVAISAPGNSNRFAESVTVRGLNVANVNANNLERFATSTLAYYLDSVPLPNIAYRIKDVERVETLLGPQGTLYGGGSLGGTVRYITNKPQFNEFSADFNTNIYQVKKGSLSHDSDLVINSPLTDALALRVSLAKLDDGGFTDRIVNPVWLSEENKFNGTPSSSKELYKDDDWEDTTSARIQLNWQINDDASINFSHINQSQLAHGTRGASRWDVDEACAAQGSATCNYTVQTAPLQVDEYTLQSVHEEYSDRDFTLNSVELEWDLGFANLTSSISSYEDTRIGQGDYLYEGFFYYSVLAYLPSVAFGNTNESGFVSYDNSYKGVTQETRLTSNSNSDLSWILGIFTTKQEKSLKFWERFKGLDDAMVADYGGFDPRIEYPNRKFIDTGYDEDIASDYSEQALYGELSYQLSPAWTVTGGARLFKYKDTAFKSINDYTGYLGIDEGESKDEDTQSIFKFNTSYNFSDNSLVYFTVSQGFRRGGTNGFRPDGDLKVATSTQNFAPDTTTNKELGVKTSLFDNQLYLQLAAYQIDWHDTQTYYSQSLLGFPLNGTVNGPDAETQGFELDLRYNINENFTVRASYATSDAEFAETAEVCLFEDNSSCRTWVKGDKLGGTPDDRKNLSINYTTEIMTGVLSADLSMRFVGDQQSARQDSLLLDDGTVELDKPYVFKGYQTANLSMNYSQDSWTVGLYVDNLTDELGETSYQRVGGEWGYKSIYIQPRTLGVTFSYNYF
jgi:iron complex outermembrane recepter protein